MDAKAIESFIHTQINAWNAGDKEAFFAAYRAAAPQGLQIEYVGKPASDGWPILEGMWAQQVAKIEVAEVVVVVNGNEAACHNHNIVRGTSMVIESIELYRFDAGHLTVRYFLKHP